VIQFVIQQEQERPAPDQVRRHLPALAGARRLDKAHGKLYQAGWEG
jgi:hypothetical protein